MRYYPQGDENMREKILPFWKWYWETFKDLYWKKLRRAWLKWRFKMDGFDPRIRTYCDKCGSFRLMVESIACDDRHFWLRCKNCNSKSKIAGIFND